ncbi:MAG TPA: peptidoglycan-binding protein [Ruminiclostridium sp.]|nr:peptidoglycan-binding protein [Ruminiclostridium sp.]
MTTGRLRIHVFKGYTYIPLENAKVTIIQNKETSSRQIIQSAVSDSSGVTNIMELEAPPLEYSMTPSDKQPYNTCKIIVEASGYKKQTIMGCQIYPGITSIQHCSLNPISMRQPDEEDILDISANTLFGNYPSKIPESATPTQNTSQPGESFAIIAAEQIVPDSVIVHYGHPNDKNASDFKVFYKDYINNVLSSEIYPTWPKEAIKANAYAVISFTLNRVFTEWYWGKGKFHITSSTATDHKFTRGIDFSSTIESVVNEVFANYVKKPAYEFPLLTQYTDGKKVPHRNGWMTQWGSKELADQGKTAFEILKYYYGSDITLFKVEKIGTLKESYPGFTLKIGSKGEPVKAIQKYLNRIAKNYPLIPKLNEDGVFDANTKKAVETFQIIFHLKKDGIVDFTTWYKISDVYVAIVK